MGGSDVAIDYHTPQRPSYGWIEPDELNNSAESFSLKEEEMIVMLLELTDILSLLALSDYK